MLQIIWRTIFKAKILASSISKTCAFLYVRVAVAFCLKVRHWISPESLLRRLPLWTLAQVADVIEGEEEAVPAGGEPSQGKGGVKLLEGQLGQLGGARPGRAHAQHHGHPPQRFAHLHCRHPDAAAEPPPGGGGLGSSSGAGGLRLHGAHHILPAALFSWR